MSLFKRMLSAFGVGGPSVDTVLDSDAVSAGEVLKGRVSIQGGSSDVVIDAVVLSLVTRVEAERGRGETGGVGEFHRLVSHRDVRVSAEQRLDLPFQLAMPWETPVTAVGDTLQPGVTVGLRTELVIKGAPDKGDLDPVIVAPLPSQERVLDAFGELGAVFRSTDVEVGRIVGVPQELSCYQEIEFFPPARFGGRLNQVELTFVANHQDLWVVLEADKRGGLFRPGNDAFGRFRMSHDEAERADWTALVGEWLEAAAERGPGQYYEGHHDYHHEHRERRGPGMGAVVGGAAAGLVGGMIIGDMMDGELFDGDEESEE